MSTPSHQSPQPARDPPSELRRDLGLVDAVGIGFGAIVGAGIFVVTGVAAGIAGPAFLVGLILAAVAATCNALSSAELAAEYPQSGGTYEYGYRVLSPWAGFAAGWMFLVSKIAAAGTVALGLAAYLEPPLPRVPPRAIAVGAILAFTILNYFGVRRSSRANLAIVAVSLSSLVLFTVAGAGAFRVENLRPFAPAGWKAVFEAAAILFFAYTGYARIATLGEEVRDPRRTIPRTTLVTIGGAVLLYIAVAAVAAGTVGAEALASTAAPLQLAARSSPYPWVATVVSVGGVTAMLGVILSQLLGLSRMVFAMARRSDLPSFLARVHPRYGVPGRAVLLIGALAAVIAATGTLRGVPALLAFRRTPSVPVCASPLTAAMRRASRSSRRARLPGCARPRAMTSLSPGPRSTTAGSGLRAETSTERIHSMDETSGVSCPRSVPIANSTRTAEGTTTVP